MGQGFCADVHDIQNVELNGLQETDSPGLRVSSLDRRRYQTSCIEIASIVGSVQWAPEEWVALPEEGQCVCFFLFGALGFEQTGRTSRTQKEHTHNTVLHLQNSATKLFRSMLCNKSFVTKGPAENFQPNYRPNSAHRDQCL